MIAAESPLGAMIMRCAQPGRVVWLGLRPARRAGMVTCDEAYLSADGLEGDHARPGKRAVTLMQQEHLAAIGSYLGREAVAPAILRRNIVVAGLNLAGLKGRDLRIGEAVLHVTAPCAPCSRMEEALGHGGYAALRGHGGWCAQVVRAGRITLGDPVAPVS